MSPSNFFSLKVKDVRQETADCVSVALDVPPELVEIFQFKPGQYLTFKKQLRGAEVRRSYSICCSPDEQELRIAIKKVDQGKFSGFAHANLKPGDYLDVMPPAGRFSPKAQDISARQYVAFAAGSGITPVLSILKYVLKNEPESRVILVYGNRNRHSIIFREAIEGLKSRYLDRFQVHHVLSREVMDVSLFNGRIDKEKVKALGDKLIDYSTVDEFFICGPEPMLFAVREELIDEGVPTERIHIELFSSPDQPTATHQVWEMHHSGADTRTSKVTVRLDGVTFNMELDFDGESILDAALKTGADLPYACKGGVCSTCRAKIVEGEVEMEVNYALEDEEVENGFVLTCQSHPRSDRVFVDFDAR